MPKRPNACSGIRCRLHGIPNLENSLALTVYQPKGVIAAIIPFNYPVELWSHKIAGGLAAGN